MSIQPPHTDGELDSETLKRDLRAATESMGAWPIAPDLWNVGTGAEEYSEYMVEPTAPACTCHDWEYRSEQIERCKHISRVLQIRGDLEIPDVDAVDPALEKQRERYAGDGR